MKKQIIFLIALLVISTGFLSGCNQENNEPQIDLTKAEIVNHTVQTRLDLTGEEYKNITGFIINNVGTKIEKIEIEAEFYDNNNNYINSKFGYTYNIANKDTGKFQVIYHSLNDYYYKVDWNKIQFKINVSKIRLAT